MEKLLISDNKTSVYMNEYDSSQYIVGIMECQSDLVGRVIFPHFFTRLRDTQEEMKQVTSKFLKRRDLFINYFSRGGFHD